MFNSDYFAQFEIFVLSYFPKFGAMHYMIIEKYKAGKAKEIYQRFEEHGRLMPDGLHYVSTWISADLSICYQVMQTDKFRTVEQWMDNWKDLVDFEVTPVITSQEAKAKAQIRA